MKILLSNPVDFITQLKLNQRPFKLISTALTKTIITDATEYYYSAKTGLKNSELNLIKTVKDHIVKNNISTRCNRKNIQYINRGVLKNGTYKRNLYEIDLKSAYWYFAYRDNHITKEIYDRGNNLQKVSKKARLIALGNLAKRKTIVEFDGVNFGNAEFEPSEGTENIFFSASAKTDAVMNRLKLIAGNDYLFYWCDAIFVSSEMAKENIENYLRSVYLSYKTIPLFKILKTSSYMKVWDDQHEKPRPFIFESIKIKDLSGVIFNNDHLKLNND